MLWTTTGKLGCGWAGAQEGGYYVVCRYKEPGNYRGQFANYVNCPIDGNYSYGGPEPGSGAAIGC